MDYAESTVEESTVPKILFRSAHSAEELFQADQPLSQVKHKVKAQSEAQVKAQSEAQVKDPSESGSHFPFHYSGP